MTIKEEKENDERRTKSVKKRRKMANEEIEEAKRK